MPVIWFNTTTFYLKYKFTRKVYNMVKNSEWELEGVFNYLELYIMRFKFKIIHRIFVESMTCLWWPSRKIHTQNHEMSTDPDPHNKFWVVIRNICIRTL